MGLLLKIQKSKEILRKALNDFGVDELYVAWSGHKDSTVTLHILKTLVKNRKINAFLNITGNDFPEALAFIDKIGKQWGVKVLKIKNPDKIKAIEEGVSKFGIKAYISAIRRDENKARKSEVYFSKRKTHMRIHPILDFTEKDIWDYIKKYKVPYLALYDKGYKSVGEKNNTKRSKGSKERSGRLESKEKLMFTLRELGYW